MKELRGPISKTSIIEESIRRSLEAKYGPILNEAMAASIAAQEIEQARKRQTAIEKARLKLLRTKDIAKLRQRVRRTYTQGVMDCPPEGGCLDQKSSMNPSEVGLIEVDY